MTIKELVLAECPGNILPVPDIYYDELQKKWQLFLQSSLNISDTDVNDETKWPPLANYLIAKLIIWDFILIAQRKSISNSSGNSKGPVKKIQTGPSIVEWADLSSYWASIAKSGIVDNIREEMCMFAIKLGIRLYLCPNIKKTKIFIIGKKPKNKC